MEKKLLNARIISHLLVFVSRNLSEGNKIHLIRFSVLSLRNKNGLNSCPDMVAYLVLTGFYFFLFFTSLRFRSLKADACGSRFSMLLSRGREGEERRRKGRGGSPKPGRNPAPVKYNNLFQQLILYFLPTFSYFVVEIRVIPLEFDMKPSRKQVKL